MKGKTMNRIRISARRSRGQRGNEMIEFALLSVFLVPLLLWTFIAGMNLIRVIQSQQICRELAGLYIGGLDFSTYTAESLAVTLSQGYGLNVGTGFSSGVSNMYDNDTNGGNGYVVVSEIMYVGSNTCAALPSGTTCTNENQYVFVQRVDFGNNNLTINGATAASAFGTPTATETPYGNIENYLTDSGAVAANFGSFLNSALADGQVIYVVETWFASPDLNFAAFPGGGMYARTFM
jgi:hypothetical protein